MRPFFQAPPCQHRLWDSLKGWLGTPFFAHAASRGAGVDCVNLIHEVLVEIDAIPRLQLPGYSLDHARHSTYPQLLLFLLTTPEIAGRFVMVPPAERLMAGDLIGIKSGRVDHHLAIVTPYAEIVHAVEGDGVIRTPLNDKKLTARTLYVLRLMETTA
ncbi:MAG TPA: hypothetical protein VGD88_06005 [Opitutaceae bacterium]